jgi:hypothetical protein
MRLRVQDHRVNGLCEAAAVAGVALLVAAQYHRVVAAATAAASLLSCDAVMQAAPCNTDDVMTDTDIQIDYCDDSVEGHRQYSLGP